MQLQRQHKYHRIAAQVAVHHSQSTNSNTSQQLGVFRWVEDAQGMSFVLLSFSSFCFPSPTVFFRCWAVSSCQRFFSLTKQTESQVDADTRARGGEFIRGIKAACHEF